MNKMIGISLMITGLILLVAGYYLFANQQRKNNDTKAVAMATTESMSSLIQAVTADGVLTAKEKKLVQQTAEKHNLNPDEAFSLIEEILSSDDTEAETEIIDQYKKKGDDFEKFIIKKFNKNYFTIKQWAGDKYVEGVYSEKTLQPDIVVEFNMGNYSKKVAIECKYRSQLNKGEVQFSYDEQLNRYKQFEKDENTDVYIALGIGGKASNPVNLYLIPLNSLSKPSLSESELLRFKRNPDDFFYLNSKNDKLSLLSPKK